MYPLKIILGLILLTFTVGCSTHNHPYQSVDLSHQSEIGYLDPAIPLSDHLRRLPGVNVKGTGLNARITMPGLKTISGDPEPLFVIDGKMIAGGYISAAGTVDVNDIASIRVLRNVNMTSQYGFRGANGVIEINTKN